MKKFKLLIGKIENTLSEEEELHLQEWIDKSKDNKLFYEYILFLHKNGKGVQEIASKDLDQVWRSFNKKQHDYVQKVRHLKRQRILRYAAIFIGLLLAIGYAFKDRLFTPTNTVTNDVVNQRLIIESEDIILKRENGEILTLKEESNLALTNNKGNVIGQVKGNTLVYTREASQELIYNEIIVPYGRTFQLELSDNTIVHLNAGTSFKYPVNFIEGVDRKVFLNEGEAFFEVKENKKNPFLIDTPHQFNIEVTGTKFNVSAYKEDNVISTVLVEGKVAVTSKNNTISLLPNYKATASKHTEEIATEIVNTNDYTAWIKGVLLLKSTTFKKIRLRLERKYNVVILNTNSELDAQLYNIYFQDETIEDVLESLKKTFDISYKIENNTIIIN